MSEIEGVKWLKESKLNNGEIIWGLGLSDDSAGLSDFTELVVNHQNSQKVIFEKRSLGSLDIIDILVIPENVLSSTLLDIFIS